MLGWQVTLEEISSALSHASVDISLCKGISHGNFNFYNFTYFRSFDVIVEVITEGLDMRNAIVAALRGQVSRKENYAMISKHVPLQYPSTGNRESTKSNITVLPVAWVLQSWNSLKLEGRVVSEEYLRGILQRLHSSPCIHEFLENVRLICIPLVIAEREQAIPAKRLCRIYDPSLHGKSCWKWPWPGRDWIWYRSLLLRDNGLPSLHRLL